MTNDINGTLIGEGIPTFRNINSAGNWTLLNCLDPDPLIIPNISGGVPFTFGIGWIDGSPGLGGAGDMTFHVTGDFNWQFVPTAASIPDASIMLLLGPGLVGIAGFDRKRFKN